MSHHLSFIHCNFTENQSKMSKTISDEQMKLSIIINGNSAQKELFDLEKSTRSLNEQNKALLLQKKLLEKQGQKDTQQYKDLTATIKANSTEVTNNKNRMAELQKEIGLTGLTMGQLQSKATMLRNTLRNLVPGSEDYKKYQAELTQVNTRLGELSGRSRTAQTSIGSLADSFNRYQGMAIAVIGALTGVVLSIQKIIDINGKLSDAQSDVMKTTGMTKVEVDELTKSFGLLQTRTSRIDLLGIAEQGGRIGIAKAEIGDFVAVMNKASVALGDSFTGGAEEVANKLGKIKFLFEETKNLNVDQSYNAIGSAINDLGANGVASEANIADFTTRIGSLTDVLKPTIQQTLALGTAFEESGIESEVSSRAYGIFMKQASTETAKFAKVMNLTQGEVETMINKNPLEFMLKFSEGMKGMNATDTAKTLDGLGISADGANKVIGAMGNNTARFRELMELSNNSFASGTSLINEYELKNNNLAATLEKISKKVSGWFSSETFIKWLGGAVDWLAKFIGATEDADGSVTAWKNTLVFIAKVIAIVTAAMITNLGWQKLVVLWTTRNTEANLLYTIGAKARAFADGVAMVASQAYAAATMLLTGNIREAQQAFRIMTATMMTTPWGFIIGAVAAIAAAYVLFADSANDAAVIQKTLSDVHLEATKNVAKEKAELELLTKIAQDESISKEKRLLAIQKLNNIIPDYIGMLSLENIKTAEGVGILQKYTAELYANARAKAVQSKFDELAKEKVDAEGKTAGDYRKEQTFGFLGNRQFDKFKNRGDFENYVKKTWGTLSKEKQNDIVNKFISASGMEDKLAEIDRIDAQMKALEPEILKTTLNDLGKPSTEASGTTTGSNYNVLGGGTGKGTGTKTNPNSNQAEINKRKLEEQAKYNEQTLKLSRQIEDDKIAAMQDGYQKELLIENNRYQREIEDLNLQKVHTDELAKLDEDIAKAKESKDMTLYNNLLIIRKGWGEKNLALDAQINAIKEGKLAIHNTKLATLEEKAAKESITKSKEAFDHAKIIRETKFNEEYAALGNNERAKAKLKKHFEASELEQETIFLNELITKLNTIIGKGKFDGIDLSLLTPEQVDTFTAEAAKVGLSLSELIKKKNELAGKTGGTDFGILQGQGTDIFGFSPEQWSSAFSNFDTMEEKIGAVSTVLGGLQNAFSMYSSFVEANSKRDLQNLDKKQSAERIKLKKQLDSKQITQAQYDKKVAKLDAEKEKAQAEAEYKRAKNEKVAALFSIAINTGIGVMKAVAASPLTGGLPWSAIIGGLGILQAGMVLAQPLPAKGYEQGLYQDYVTREQDGKRFKSSYQGKTRSGLVSKTSHFLVAENGPEMVIDNKAWRQMNPAVKDSLIRELRGVKGFEQGLYNQAVQRYEVPASSSPAPSGGDAQMNQMWMSIMAENLAVLKEIRESGILAIVSNKDLSSMKNLKEGIDDYNKLRNKSKK
jgi:tubulin-specific chaperone A